MMKHDRGLIKIIRITDWKPLLNIYIKKYMLRKVVVVVVSVLSFSFS